MARGATTPAVPDGWRVVRLREVCDGARYGASAPARPFDPDLPRYVRITDISDAGRLRADDPRSADPERVQGYELHPGDLLFARSGSVGRTYLYRPEDGPCVYAGYLIRFRPDPDVALPRFVELCTHSPAYHRWIESVLHAGAQPNINAAEYGSLPILLPPLDEQRRIAAVLDAIDDAIERSEAVIAATEELRRSLLHELLSRGVPGWHSEWREVAGLGVVPACWEVVRLGEVAEVRSGTGFPLNRQGRRSGAYPFIKVSDMTLEGNETYIHTANNYVDDDDARDLRANIFAPDTVVFPKVGAAIATNKKRALTVPTIIDNNMVGITVSDAGTCDARFLHNWLESIDLSQVANVSTVPSITGSRLKREPLPLPPLAEQRLIAGGLDGVDSSLGQARAGTDVLRSMGASASEALLSGQVRVHESVDTLDGGTQ